MAEADKFIELSLVWVHTLATDGAQDQSPSSPLPELVRRCEKKEKIAISVWPGELLIRWSIKLTMSS